MDALGSAIRIDTRGREVHARTAARQRSGQRGVDFRQDPPALDGLMRQRLDRPYVRETASCARRTGREAFAAIADKVKAAAPEKIGVIGGDLARSRTMFAAKSLAEALGTKNIDCRQDGARLDPALGRASYIFNPTVEGVDRADALLIDRRQPALGIAGAERPDPQALAAPAISRSALIGEPFDLTYDYDNLGAGPRASGQDCARARIRRNRSPRPSVR